MALVINADDFGKSDSVNAAICEAFEKGLVTRTTLMANMPCAADAMELARSRGFADRVGLHLNLTSGRPLTPSLAKDPVFCNENGEFTADFARNLKTRFHLPKDTRGRLESEIRAQLDEYKRLGATLWHIDSHHHVHTDPSVFSVLAKVIPDYPVTSIRLSRNMYRGGNPLMRLYKSMFNARLRRLFPGTVEFFGSADDYRRYLQDPSGFAENHEVEVMVHPIYDENGTMYDAGIGKLM